MSQRLQVDLTPLMVSRVVAAFEEAAISGLCREGQLEIAAQTIRELRPDLDSRESLALATEIHDTWEA